MISTTIVCLIGLLVSGITYHFTKNRALFSAAITFGTIFYHPAIRLFVGLLLTSCGAFCFDAILVIMQRYNRPRLIRLLRNERPASRDEGRS